MAAKSKSGKRGSYKARWEREAIEFQARLEQNLRHFEAAVLASFSFLETEYGYQRRPLQRRNFEDFRDADVILPYYGPSVAVQAYYVIGDIRLGAALFQLQNGELPERVSFWGDAGYAPAITLDSYVAMVSGGKVPPVLVEPSPRKPRIGMDRAADLRREALRSNMAGVVAQVAERLKTFCAPILRGDTSCFAAVQHFHRQKYSLGLFPAGR